MNNIYIHSRILRIHIDILIAGASPLYTAISFAPLLEEPPVRTTTTEVICLLCPIVTTRQCPKCQTTSGILAFRRTRHSPDTLFQLPVFRFGPTEKLPIIRTQLKWPMRKYYICIIQCEFKSILWCNYTDL